MSTEYCVFIGRFQPFHNAHLEIVKNALDEAEKVIIVVGSHRRARSLANPWTYEERVKMIRSALPSGCQDRVIIVPARDYLYCNLTWLTGIQNTISQIVRDSKSVKIIGHFKDDSSFYLKLFPQWTLVEQPNFFGIDATDIRKELFASGGVNQCLAPLGIIEYILKYSNTDGCKALMKEQRFLTNYKSRWAGSPFEPTFVTTDAVVVQAGHVLLIKRGINPGKGMYALPGGFLQKKTRLLESCLNELKEETNIVFPKEELRKSLVDEKVFDHPSRDLRGRTLTHGYYFRIDQLGPLPGVKGGDDAAEAFWMPISDLALHEEIFFSDHFYILNYFLRGIGK
jgi:bifunctional NMN adenylyltransferase/nudix hydrolase